MKTILLFLLPALAVLAPANEGQFSKVSVQQQIKLGQQVAIEIRAHEKVLPQDDRRVAMLRNVAAKILASIHDKEAWAFSFDVIDSPVVNAFSLPGGPTFFYTGLMDKLKTEDELAGVLAHELTHVRKQHWAIQYASAQRRDLLINLGLILSRANFDASQLAGLADDLIFNLPFSRSEEAEADAGGELLVVQAGYNPNGMISVFRMFSKILGAAEGPTFLSDHPSDQDRIDRLSKSIGADLDKYPAQKPLSY